MTILKFFLNKIVTGNETWIYQFDPESKQQLKQWLLKGSSTFKKTKAEKSTVKVMATIFWNSDKVLLINRDQIFQLECKFCLEYLNSRSKIFRHKNWKPEIYTYENVEVLTRTS